LVTNCAARAAAGKRNFDLCHLLESQSGISASTSFANSMSDSCQPK
jgi:hypothetical protein